MAYGNYAPFYRGGFFNPMQTQMPPQMQMPMQGMPDGAQMGQGFAPMQGAPMQNGTGDGMIYVLNENEATSYPVAPGNTVTLWDKNLTTIYIKSADMNGVPSMRILDCKERVQGASQQSGGHQCQCGGKYAPIADFEALRQDFLRLSARVDALQPAVTVRQEQKEDGINE